MSEPAASETGGALPAGWQPLPQRARALFVLGAIAPAIVAAGFAGGVLARIASGTDLLTADGMIAGAVGVLAGAALGAGFGLWLGLKHYRFTSWCHDHEGLAVRRGRLWQQETRVPATRVQHLDIKRGPWQRRRDLATLIVHTAGTRHSAVTVPNLDAGDAERLRDRLARQLDDDEQG